MDKQKKYDIFVCASIKDGGIVDAICSELGFQGISYFSNIEETEEKDPKVTAEAITESNLFLFVASRQSYLSPFASKELVYAFNNIPTEHILVYVADLTNLPENIAFTVNKDNIFRNKQTDDIFEEDFNHIDSELTQRICTILGREQKTKKKKKHTEKKKSLAHNAVVSFAIWGGIIGLGIYFHIILPILFIVLGLSFLYLIVHFWPALRDRFNFSNSDGKCLVILRTLFFLIILLSIPFGVWMGIESHSWWKGILWCFGIMTVSALIYEESQNLFKHLPLKKQGMTKRKSLRKSYDYYVCYDEKDEDIVRRIVAELRRNGMTYLTRREGDVEKCVEACRAFLYIASNNCYQNTVCDDELKYGFNHRRPILAYIVDQTPMPEDKQLVFSNSNFRTITTHPIETTLMSDLKRILEDNYQQSFFAKHSRSLHIALLVFFSIMGIVGTIFNCLHLNTYSLAIVTSLCALVVYCSIDDIVKKRLLYSAFMATEIIIIDCAIVIFSFLLPNAIWLLLHPDAWMAVLIGFTIVILLGLFMGEVYEPVAEKNPTGRLSPKQLINYFDVFVSYCRRNTIEANEVCDELHKTKISYFIDRQGIPGGAEFPSVLADGISNCGLFLFLKSPESLTSKFCQQERQFAEKKKNKEEIITFDLIEDKSDGWEESLVNTIKEKLPQTHNYKSNQLQKKRKSSISMIIDIVKKTFKYSS